MANGSVRKKGKKWYYRFYGEVAGLTWQDIVLLYSSFYSPNIYCCKSEKRVPEKSPHSDKRTSKMLRISSVAGIR